MTSWLRNERLVRSLLHHTHLPSRIHTLDLSKHFGKLASQLSTFRQRLILPRPPRRRGHRILQPPYQSGLRLRGARHRTHCLCYHLMVIPRLRQRPFFVLLVPPLGLWEFVMNVSTLLSYLGIHCYVMSGLVYPIAPITPLEFSYVSTFQNFQHSSVKAG
jgi:hypothetical protein